MEDLVEVSDAGIDDFLRDVTLCCHIFVQKNARNTNFKIDATVEFEISRFTLNYLIKAGYLKINFCVICDNNAAPKSCQTLNTVPTKFLEHFVGQNSSSLSCN